MASSIPLQIAETVQTAHIVHDPSAAHDINPSTAASRREPVILEKPSTTTTTSSSSQHSQSHPLSDFDDGIDLSDHSDDEEIPYSVIRSKPRRSQRSSHHLPPIPDLRYEQSYLHSIRLADTWWKVLLITARDQIMMPFAQGILYNLFICGWQQWNRNAQLSGSSVGAKVRRWWWRVNDWPVPGELPSEKRSQGQPWWGSIFSKN
ncbi:hypothetical protein QBC46DRAFT_385114 [Diplogelasinospora grovesii]|uniref:DUF1770-domain-containing protein n=1 Tax=Diplogelasinospora grovesii TaxID=303347 RepID=A0AAN6S5D9_9PEZI|nr:hypothetical protein QBC46DRAFT_385114 [Diplogelasinospora grovesii]